MKYYLICYMSPNGQIHTRRCTNIKLTDIIKISQSVKLNIISISEIEKEIFDLLEEIE